MLGRAEHAADLIDAGTDPAAVVAAVAAEFGLSPRQAQRVVRRGRALLAAEAAEADRPRAEDPRVTHMAGLVGDHIADALAEGDRRGAAALLGRWSDLLAKAGGLPASPAAEWDAALGADALSAAGLPASLPF